MDQYTGPTRRVIEASAGGFFFRALLFIFVLAIVVLEFPGARELRQSPDSGIETRNLRIVRIRPDGPNAASDIRAGDDIFAINGVRLRNHTHYLNEVARNAAFAPQVYTLQRDGLAVNATVVYGSIPGYLVARRFAFVIVAFAFVLVGLWVYLRRPDWLGVLFATNCVILAFFLTERPAPSVAWLQLAGELIHDALILLFPAALLHFFLVFSERPGDESRRPLWRRRMMLLYGVPLVIYFCGAIVATLRFQFVPVPDGVLTVVLALSTLYFAAYMTASLVVFVTRYRSSPRAHKQKLRVVIAGSVVGFVPLLALTVLRNVVQGDATAADTRLESVAALCLGVVPITFAYSILKHGAIELNLVVRKSLVYAVLTGAIIATYYALVNVISDVMVSELGVREIVWAPLSILFLSVMFAPARERIQRIVDRLFYRGEYVYKQEVYEFNRQIAGRLTRDEIMEYFLERCNALLNPSFVAVYHSRAGHELDLETTSGDAPALPRTFPTESFLGRYASRFRRPIMVEFLDRSWERPRIDDESRAFLAIPGLAVCLPLATSDELVGMILLGAKRSGFTYRRTDAELLETFGEQLTLVLQNAQLLQASLEKERLESEVMLARDIQLSLLPDAPPAYPGFEIRGQMVSSHEVGGDYFDYFPIDDRRLAVCIGDVSGKGVPAAMLMASIRAVFKNAAVKGKLPPAELNAELNQYLFENAKADQFATFFYGVFESDTGTFTFSNAGQCPALLVKQDYVDRLGQGGLVLGVQPAQSYHEGRVCLEPDDLLVLYTDGITEQKNDAGEEYGEERLIEFLQLHRNLPLGELQSALFRNVIAFGNGSQQDDITSVIACQKAA